MVFSHSIVWIVCSVKGEKYRLDVDLDDSHRASERGQTEER